MVKNIISKTNLGSTFDLIGALEPNKINVTLPAINEIPLTFVPTLTGNATNKNEFVTDVNGESWFIDIYGDSKKFASNIITTSLVPKVYQGSAFANAQANI